MKKKMNKWKKNSPNLLLNNLGEVTTLLDRFRKDVFSLSDKLLVVGAVSVRKIRCRSPADKVGVGGSLPGGFGTGQNTRDAKSS